MSDRVRKSVSAILVVVLACTPVVQGYEYVRSNPINRRDPSGLTSYTEMMTTMGLYGSLGMLGVGAIGGVRAGVDAYVAGLPPRAVAAAMLQGANMTMHEKMGATLLLSAVAATGPVGLAAVAGLGAGLGLQGYTEAQAGIRDAQDFNELFLASYDGMVSSGVMAGSFLAIEGAAPAGLGTSIRTAEGVAVQGVSRGAFAARARVLQGGTLWRIGTTGRSNVAEAQFWALEHPSAPGFASRYGIPAQNVTAPDFIQSGILKPGTPFVTRTAKNGTGIEVVVPPGGVQLESVSVPYP